MDRPPCGCWRGFTGGLCRDRPPVVHVCYLFAGKHRESDLAEQIKVRLQGEGLLSEIGAYDLLRGGDSHDLSSIALREQIDHRGY